MVRRESRPERRLPRDKYKRRRKVPRNTERDANSLSLRTKVKLTFLGTADRPSLPNWQSPPLRPKDPAATWRSRCLSVLRDPGGGETLENSSHFQCFIPRVASTRSLSARPNLKCPITAFVDWARRGIDVFLVVRRFFAGMRLHPPYGSESLPT